MSNHCIILAGGIGSRLWPVSRQSKPKQFLDLFGVGRTLLQQTFDRFARFVPRQNIYISTHEDYLALVEDQLPEVPRCNIFDEPLQRGTLASVAWATNKISAIDPQANIIVSPADQLILGEDEFKDDVLHALDYASREQHIVVLGVHPSRPETDYGYIQQGGEPIEGDFFKVKSFTEKPQKEFAEMFIQSGDFLWNAGLYAFQAPVMTQAIQRLAPEYDLHLPFSMLPKLSIDLGIMERSDNVYVHECHFHWADLGTWATLTQGADHLGNLSLNTPTLLHQCRGTVVRLPEGITAIVEGLDDYLVAQEGDVLLICPKSRPTVRRLMNQYQIT